jgi:hypothetical protein
MSACPPDEQPQTPRGSPSPSGWSSCASRSSSCSRQPPSNRRRAGLSEPEQLGAAVNAVRELTWSFKPEDWERKWPRALCGRCQGARLVLGRPGHDCSRLGTVPHVPDDRDRTTYRQVEPRQHHCATGAVRALREGLRGTRQKLRVADLSRGTRPRPCAPDSGHRATPRECHPAVARQAQ